MNLLLILVFLMASVVSAGVGTRMGGGGSRADGRACMEGSSAAQGPREGGKEELLKRIESVYVRFPELKHARGLWEAGRFDEAEKEFLAAAAVADAELSAAAHYLRASMLAEAGEKERAAQVFEETAAATSLVRDWALYRAGEQRLEAKQYDCAIADFSKLSERFPLLRRAQEKSCEAAWLMGDRPAFERCIKQLKRNGELPDALLLLEVKRAIDAGKVAEGAEKLKKILVKFPTSAVAREVQELANKLRKNKEGKWLELSNDEKLDQAERLCRAHRYSKAAKLVQKVLHRAKKGSRLWCRSNSLMALVLARQGEQTKSMPFFSKFVDNCDAMLTDSILYRGVEAASLAGRVEEAAAWADLLVGRFPESTLGDDALLFVARLYDRKGDAGGARSKTEQILQIYPRGDMAPDAAWLTVFSLYRAGDYSEAAAAAARFLPLLPERQDYRTNGRLQYWLGRCRQQLGEKRAASAWFKQVVEKYPLSWYALLSLLRLEELESGAAAECMEEAVQRSERTLPTEKEVLAAHAHRHATRSWLEPALFLLSIGMKDEARIELNAMVNRDGVGIEHQLAVAWVYHQIGDLVSSHHLISRKVGDFAYAWPQPDDDRWWKIAYPRAFSDLVNNAAAQHGVPWSLINAVMREESGFDPAIESYAHALGLMQLLRKTAIWVAKKDLSRSEVFQPSMNVSIGARYLRYLLDRFSHPALAVAAYNSGPGGVNKTLELVRNDELDEFVETIPYDQTRRYTKRVLSSAWTYQMLYGDDSGIYPLNLHITRRKGLN